MHIPRDIAKELDKFIDAANGKLLFNDEDDVVVNSNSNLPTAPTSTFDWF